MSESEFIFYCDKCKRARAYVDVPRPCPHCGWQVKRSPIPVFVRGVVTTQRTGKGLKLFKLLCLGWFGYGIGQVIVSEGGYGLTHVILAATFLVLTDILAWWNHG